MLKSLLTAGLTVTLTVFLTPAAEMAYKHLDKPQERRHRSAPAMQTTRVYSSVLERLAGFVWGAEYAPEVACILGEAEDQGIEGMTAVAEAIRNRGHLRGVYGCRSPRLQKASADSWEQAAWAWERSAFTNLVKGADHWHSDREPQAWWEKYGTQTAKIGSHKFYKEVRR